MPQHFWLWLGKQQHPGAQHSPCETASSEHLSQPQQLSCQQYIYTNQEKQHSRQFNLNPFPSRNAVLGKRSSKGKNICRTSGPEVRGKLRQLKSLWSSLRSKSRGLNRGAGWEQTQPRAETLGLQDSLPSSRAAQ